MKPLKIHHTMFVYLYIGYMVICGGQVLRQMRSLYSSIIVFLNDDILPQYNILYDDICSTVHIASFHSHIYLPIIMKKS